MSFSVVVAGQIEAVQVLEHDPDICLTVEV